MKRIAVIVTALLLTIPLFAAGRTQVAAPADAVDGAADRAAEPAFPTISVSQERKFLKIATEDEVMCGYHPSLPSNCFYKCLNGAPVLNSDGTQRVMCYDTPTYPEGESGYCNFYFVCAPYQNTQGKVCAYTGFGPNTCQVAFGTCSTCGP